MTTYDTHKKLSGSDINRDLSQENERQEVVMERLHAAVTIIKVIPIVSFMLLLLPFTWMMPKEENREAGADAEAVDFRGAAAHAVSQPHRLAA